MIEEIENPTQIAGVFSLCRTKQVKEGNNETCCF